MEFTLLRLIYFYFICALGSSVVCVKASLDEHMQANVDIILDVFLLKWITKSDKLLMNKFSDNGKCKK